MKKRARERPFPVSQTALRAKAAVWLRSAAVVLVPVFLLAAWHFGDVWRGIAETGHVWQAGVYLALAAAALGGLGLLGWLILVPGEAASWRPGWLLGKQNPSSGKPDSLSRQSYRRLERIYPAAGLLLGMLYLAVLPPLSAPDEISHYVSACQLSSRILGQPSNDRFGRVLLRPQDAWVEDLDGTFAYEADEDGNLQVIPETLGAGRKLCAVLDESAYQMLWELRGGRQYAPERLASLNGALVSSTYPPVVTTPLAYVPQAMGMVLARLLGMKTLALMYLGRVGNLLFFVLMTWLAMGRLPFGKEVLFGVALLPMTLHLSASLSYDVMILGCMFLFTAVCLDLAYEKERAGIGDIGLLMVLMAVCGPCKLIYAVMMGLCLLIPVRKFGGWKGWALAAAAVGGAWAVAMYVVNSQVVASYVTETETYVGWAGEPGYSMLYLAHHPVRLVRMFYQTLLWQSEWYYLTMIGAYLGSLDEVLNVPYLAVAAFTLGLLELAFKKPGEHIRMSLVQRIWVMVVCGLCVAAAMFSMLIACTPLSSWVIDGVQGRYFLPFLPVLLMACKNRMVVLTRDRSRKVLYWMCCLNGFVVLRLFSVICMRL